MKIVFLIILQALIFSSSAWAFDKLFGAEFGDNRSQKEIAMAIARQESGMKPLCVNVAGEDFWPETREEAEKIIRKAQKKDQSYDVGLMQINSQWIKQWKIDPVILLDPATNIRYGARILRDEIKRHGMNWRAIASYHSPDPERGRRYALSVFRRLGKHPEVRAMLVNPRLRGALMQSRRLRNLRVGISADKSLLPAVNAMRKPTGVN